MERRTRRTRGRAGRGGWWPLAVIASAHLMAVLDTTVMFVALPSVQRGLGLTVAGRQWVVTSYTLALAGLLLLGGRLADRFGARNTLLIGVVGFACASAVGGAAVDGAMLIAARAVQGAFGAVLVSSTKSLLVNVYTDGQERARAIGIFTATLTAGLALGLVLGGVLTSALNWRWCLYVNIPLSLVAILGAPRVLPALPGRREIRIDVASAVLASAGMVALIYGLGEASVLGWGSGQVTGSLIAAAVLLGGFVARQAGRPGRLLPLRVVLDRNRGWGDDRADRQRAEHVRDDAHPDLPAAVGHALLGAGHRAGPRPVRRGRRAGLGVPRAPADGPGAAPLARLGQHRDRGGGPGPAHLAHPGQPLPAR